MLISLWIAFVKAASYFGLLNWRIHVTRDEPHTRSCCDNTGSNQLFELPARNARSAEESGNEGSLAASLYRCKLVVYNSIGPARLSPALQNYFEF